MKNCGNYISHSHVSYSQKSAYWLTKINKHLEFSATIVQNDLKLLGHHLAQVVGHGKLVRLSSVQTSILACAYYYNTSNYSGRFQTTSLYGYPQKPLGMKACRLP